MRTCKRVIGLVLSAVIAGCSSGHYLPPDSQTQERLQSTALLIAPFQAMEAIDQPVRGSGEGALSGAGQGAAVGIRSGIEFCRVGEPFSCMFGLALGIALAVPSAMVGGVIGASSAHSEEEVDTATQSLLSALVAAAPDDALATNLPDVGRMNAGADLKLHDWKDGLAQNYKPLVDNGFDSAVEITVRAIRIDVIGDIDPDVSPVVIVEARLVSIPDGERLYERVWQYSGVERNFFRAAEDDARLFRSDLDNGYSHLASRIINDLFIARGVEKSRPPRPGTIVTIDGPVGDENTEHQIAETSIKATSNPAARSMTIKRGRAVPFTSALCIQQPELDIDL